MRLFVRIIRDPAPTEEVSTRVFYESLQIPNNVLVSQFHGKVNSTARHLSEERGGVSRVISI